MTDPLLGWRHPRTVVLGFCQLIASCIRVSDFRAQLESQPICVFKARRGRRISLA